MAYLRKVDGDVRDGLQVYDVRWKAPAPDGTWKSRQARCVGHDAALEQKRRVEKELAERGRISRPDTATAEVCTWWLERYGTRRRRRGKAVEETSWEEAARVCRLLTAHVGATTAFSTLTPDDIEELLENRVNLLDGEPASAGTRNRMLGVLKGICGDAARAGFHHDNIAQGISAFSDGPARDPDAAQPPSFELLCDLAEALDRRETTFTNRWGQQVKRPAIQNVHDPERFFPSDRMWLFAYTGLRFSEARGLRVSDDRGSVLSLRETWPKKARAPRPYGKNAVALRDVPVPPQLRPYLDRLKEYSRCGRLLTGPDGQVIGYETWRNWLARAAQEVGFEGRTHQLRHFAASLWIKAGASELAVMKAGGWSDLHMVSSIYGHLWRNDIEELAATIGTLDVEKLA